MLQTALGAADIPMVLRVETADKVRAALQAGEHEMALVETTVAGGDPHLFLFPLSTSEGASKGPRALNYSFYRNPRLDDVLVRASQLRPGRSVPGSTSARRRCWPTTCRGYRSTFGWSGAWPDPRCATSGCTRAESTG